MKFLHFLISFWMNANRQLTPLTAETCVQDARFSEYRKCLTNTESLLFGKCDEQGADNPEYASLNYQFNQALPKVYPIAIFTPKSTIDVQTAVKCGVKTNIQLVPISGGHSYAGLSYGTNDSILIDFRHMNSISLNDDKTVVTVETGTMFGQLYYNLATSGLMVAAGSCMTVAIGGYILGGGVGHFSNYYGLAIDNVVELSMVDASGRAVVVDEGHNMDLWWALRGIGPGYIGLLTSVKMKVHRLDEYKFVHLKIRFRNDNFKNVMEAYVKWLSWVKKRDPKLSSVITVHSENEIELEQKAKVKYLDRRGIVLDIIKVHPNKTGDTKPDLDFILYALELFAKNVEYHSFQFDYANHTELLARVSYGANKTYSERLNVPKNLDYFSNWKRSEHVEDETSYQDHRSFFVKDSPITKYLEAKHFEEVQKILSDMPVGGTMIIDDEQGQIGEKKPTDSAYVHRDCLFDFSMSISTNSTDFDAGKKWLDKFYDSVKFLDSGATFQNYPDRLLKDDNSYLKRFYGVNLKRLIEIKRKWDPNHYFNSEMSLPISNLSCPCNKQ